jgi:hypothetical protein
MSPQLGVQLKASVIEQGPNNTFDFRLSRKNYDDLRQRSMIPRILVVFAMPADPSAWLTLAEDALLLRRCAYWCPLLGAPDSENERYQTVCIDRRRIFCAEALQALMIRASREEAILHGA